VCVTFHFAECRRNGHDVDDHDNEGSILMILRMPLKMVLLLVTNAVFFRFNTETSRGKRGIIQLS